MRRWCDERKLPQGALLSLPATWTLAKRWYDDRFELDWRRRSPAEREAILRAAGLSGPFWSLGPAES